MLVLKRKEGQWVDVTHRSGDVLRIRVCRIEPGIPGQLNLAFDDDPRNFEIERPERKRKAMAATAEDRREASVVTAVEDRPC